MTTIIPSSWDLLLTHANLITLEGNDYGLVRDGAIAVSDGIIEWIGSTDDLPINNQQRAKKTLDLDGKWISPGLVDCHTHLVFGGNRADEFEKRLQGIPYEEIAKAGGGIVNTVSKTRQATYDELYRESSRRLKCLIAEGVTTVEIKSGYGLEYYSELKMLRVARQLGDNYPVTIKTSFLGAHAIPPEYSDKRGDYIDVICKAFLPDACEEKLVDAVDAYCETIAFSFKEVEQVFRVASDLNVPVKLHADQFSDSNGAKLAAEYNALSADHLEYTSEAGIKAMADAGTAAVLLPCAFYILRETQLPPVEIIRDYQLPLAISTDLNPGSSPVASVLLSMNMACTFFHLTPVEALRGVTVNAAIALGLGKSIGTLRKGKQADLAVWDINHPAELAYWAGLNPCVGVVKNGAIVNDTFTLLQ